MKKYKAILIDDLEENQILYNRMLESIGFENNILLSGDKDLHRLLKKQSNQLQDVDIILMDIVIPGLDGFQLSKFIKRHKILSELPIVVLSANLNEDNKIKAIESNCQAYLKKPLSINDFEFIKKIVEMRNQIKTIHEKYEQKMLEVQQIKSQYEGSILHSGKNFGLTGISYHKDFKSSCFSEWSECHYRKKPYSALMFDIDFMQKLSNENEKTMLVKNTLKQVVNTLTKTTPKTPLRIIHEYGPEFFVCLPHTNQQEAVIIGQAIQSAMELLHTNPSSPKFTLSLGIATAHPVIKAAFPEFVFDLRSALLKAKIQGGDQIVSLQSPSSKPSSETLSEELSDQNALIDELEKRLLEF